MMMAPVPLIRRNHVIKKLRQAGAVSPETAVTFAAAGIINPGGFRRVTEVMLRRGLLGQTGDRFYLRNNMKGK